MKSKESHAVPATAPLTARYRPQLFAEVAGQQAIRAILSRAAAEGKVAPAYLFSGTRGVGKTTLARIFAKALNCVNGPDLEPCNNCESCRQITQGIAVDVAEIDGASNRGIDDAKRLKEDIGYAPLEGRYKIFIIDEAHMLTREAFNALLKTLEEPPGRVTFILATTEPHKFPATIISRCQHFIFKRLSQLELKDHLSKVLTSEGIAFEEEAVNLLARRAAGSVRDGMSLLGQVLALGSVSLSEDDTRNVLGLAGQELFLQLVQATVNQNCVQVAQVVQSLLEKGVDMGFFLRELGALWRNLFMLRQAGKSAYKVLDITPAEGELWQEATKDLATAHIHACWQLTLEGQRRVLDSLEPGQALELLLLNIAILPSLIPVSSLPSLPVSPTPSSPPLASVGDKPEVEIAAAKTTGPQSTPENESGVEKKNNLNELGVRDAHSLQAKKAPTQNDSVKSAFQGSNVSQSSQLNAPVTPVAPVAPVTPVTSGLAAPSAPTAANFSSSHSTVANKSVFEKMEVSVPNQAMSVEAGTNPASSKLLVSKPETSEQLTPKQSSREQDISSPVPDFFDQDVDWQEGYGTDLAGSELDDQELALGAGEDLFEDSPFLEQAVPSKIKKRDELKAEPVTLQTSPQDVQPIQALQYDQPLQSRLGAEQLETQTKPEDQSEFPRGLEALFTDDSALKTWAEFIKFCISNREAQQAQRDLADGMSNISASVQEPMDFDSDQEELEEIDELGLNGQSEAGINPLLLHKAKGAFKGNSLHIICPSDISYEHLLLPAQTGAMRVLAEKFLGRQVNLTILPPLSRAKTRGDLREEAQQHPSVKLLKEKLGAYLLDCIPEEDF